MITTTSKKVLLIGYYFPPCAGVGILRTAKLTKYLTRMGYDLTVFTAKPAQYPSIDFKGLEEIPPQVTVLRQGFFEPHRFYQLLTGTKSRTEANNALVLNTTKKSFWHHFAVWLRSNFFIPDARMCWISPSIRLLTKYLQENPVEVIISTGPPHSAHLIALALKKKWGNTLHWIADFQDPWTQVDYYQYLHLTHWADQKHRRLEQDVFRHADCITTVSKSWKEDLSAIGARNVHAIPLGYDEDDFTHIVPQLDETLTITHAGLLGGDRLPLSLLAALAQLAQKNPSFMQKVRFQLVGQIDKTVLALADKWGISSMLVYKGEQSRTDVLQLIANSQLVLLLLNKASNAKGRIPAKFFEYVALRRPIVCLGEKNSEVAHLITQNQLGECFSYDEQDELTRFLEKTWNSFSRQGNIPYTPRSLSSLTCQKSAEMFAQLIQESEKGRQVIRQTSGKLR